MPVLYLEAVAVKSTWTPSSVGLLRNDPSTFDCPVFTTTFRGPTFVFLATLRSAHLPSKWTLAGTALIMQDDE